MWIATVLGMAVAIAAPSHASTRQASTGTFAGYAFHDVDADGIRGVTERGVPAVSVYLFTCADMIKKTTKTNKKGYYTLEGVEDGQYYIYVPSVPAPYEFSDVWNGMADESGASFPDMDSAVDPETGRSACFDVVEGATVDVSFGLVALDVPPTPPPLSNAPTAKPTNPVMPTIPVTVDPTKAPTNPPSTPAPTTPQPTTVNPTTANPTKAPTNVPSTPMPTPFPSMPPTAPPTAVPTSEPSAPIPVASPVKSPTASPTLVSQPNNLQELPPTTEQYIMDLFGIDQLEDEEAWARRTSDYIVEYFTSVEPEKVFNLTVDILVVQQQSSSSNSSSEQAAFFTRRRARRRLQGGGTKHVTVVYNQTSAYATANPMHYYVASRPFESGSEGYIAALTDLSSHYNGVESIGPIQSAYAVDDSGGAQSTTPDDGSEGSGANKGAIAAGVVCALIVIAAILAVAYLERRRRKGGTEYMQPVGNGPLSSMVPRSSLEVEPRSCSLGNAFDDAVFDVLPGPPEHSSSYLSTGSEIVVDVVAPPGKLGVVLDTRPEGGPAYVTTIKEACPIADQIFLGDKVIAVDGDDVQKVSAKKICQMLAQRCDNEERKITVLREAGDA